MVTDGVPSSSLDSALVMEAIASEFLVGPLLCTRECATPDEPNETCGADRHGSDAAAFADMCS